VKNYAITINAETDIEGEFSSTKVKDLILDAIIKDPDLIPLGLFDIDVDLEEIED
jgi:hypothetical protein